MHVVLLCPGPSLARYPGGAAGLTLGVNRAATLQPCDVWVCGDFPCVQNNAPAVRGDPLLVTESDCVSELRKRGAPWRGRTFEFGTFARFCPYWDDWRQSCEVTAMWALLYAGYRGAKRIDCWGVDWAGTADWDGFSDGNNRSPERWRYERQVWEHLLVPWLNARGVAVTRNGVSA